MQADMSGFRRRMSERDRLVESDPGLAGAAELHQEPALYAEKMEIAGERRFPPWSRSWPRPRRGSTGTHRAWSNPSSHTLKDERLCLIPTALLRILRSAMQCNYAIEVT